MIPDSPINEDGNLDWVGDDATTGPNLKTVESGWDGKNKKKELSLNTTSMWVFVLFTQFT